jgi:hypothetical protein
MHAGQSQGIRAGNADREIENKGKYFCACADANLERDRGIYPKEPAS